MSTYIVYIYILSLKFAPWSVTNLVAKICLLLGSVSLNNQIFNVEQNISYQSSSSRTRFRQLAKTFSFFISVVGACLQRRLQAKVRPRFTFKTWRISSSDLWQQEVGSGCTLSHELSSCFTKNNSNMIECCLIHIFLLSMSIDNTQKPSRSHAIWNVLEFQD